MAKKSFTVHSVLPPSTAIETHDFDLEIKPLTPKEDQVHEAMHEIFGKEVKILAFVHHGPSLGEMFDEYYEKKATEKAAGKAAD